MDSIALSEHNDRSKSPLARGLRVINTEKATVSVRYVSPTLGEGGQYADLIALVRESMLEVVF